MRTNDVDRLFPDIDPAAIDLLSMLDMFHEGVMITDAQGVVRYMNAVQARIDDLKVGDAIGRTVADLYRVDEGTSPVMQCLKTGRVITNLACYYRTHLGRVVNSIHNVYPIRAQGCVIGAVCIITDYKNIQQTFDAVGKSRPSRFISTFGALPEQDRRNPQGNGTRYTFDDIIGTNADLLAAIKTAQLASASPSPVMICGESGTGKEMVAQSIHNRSPWKSGPYVAINCAAIPENLLEGMLFGTARGAFTGAIDKAGLLETADGGTLFLDEVNSMSPGLQAKLLRFLQERKVRRVGAVREIDVALKIVSSVNTPPHEAIASGLLRADLFYRLAVVFIHLPPLRERKGDLNQLTTHFLDRCNRQLDKRIASVDAAVMNRFTCYDWPGNVRELAHIIEGAMNLVVGDHTLRMDHLSVPLPLDRPPAVSPPLDPHSASSLSDRMQRLTAASPEPTTVTKTTLFEMQTHNEFTTIVDALTATGGNAAGAARCLGISPQLMHYKMRRLGIDRRNFKDH